MFFIGFILGSFEAILSRIELNDLAQVLIAKCNPLKHE